MSSIEEFVCYDCMEYWQGKYSFWSGYKSRCPRCGNRLAALCLERCQRRASWFDLSPKSGHEGVRFSLAI